MQQRTWYWLCLQLHHLIFKSMEKWHLWTINNYSPSNFLVREAKLVLSILKDSSSCLVCSFLLKDASLSSIPRVQQVSVCGHIDNSAPDNNNKKKRFKNTHTSQLLWTFNKKKKNQVAKLSRICFSDKCINPLYGLWSSSCTATWTVRIRPETPRSHPGVKKNWYLAPSWVKTTCSDTVQQPHLASSVNVTLGGTLAFLYRNNK